jgi:hypothetical protein
MGGWIDIIYGRIVSTGDILDASKIREESFNAMITNQPPSERARNRSNSTSLVFKKRAWILRPITAVKEKFWLRDMGKQILRSLLRRELA